MFCGTVNRITSTAGPVPSIGQLLPSWSDDGEMKAAAIIGKYNARANVFLDLLDRYPEEHAWSSTEEVASVLEHIVMDLEALLST